MKEIERFDLYFDEMRLSKDGFWCKYRDVLKLQARIKELESEKHINEIKAQGINEAIEQARHDFFGLDAICDMCIDKYGRDFKEYAEQLRSKNEKNN